MNKTSQCLFCFVVALHSSTAMVVSGPPIVRPLPDIEMNDTRSSAIKLHPSKQLCRGGQTLRLILGRLRTTKQLTSTQVPSQCTALRNGTL